MRADCKLCSVPNNQEKDVHAELEGTSHLSAPSTKSLTITIIPKYLVFLASLRSRMSRSFMCFVSHIHPLYIFFYVDTPPMPCPLSISTSLHERSFRLLPQEREKESARPVATARTRATTSLRFSPLTTSFRTIFSLSCVCFANEPTTFGCPIWATLRALGNNKALSALSFFLIRRHKDTQQDRVVKRLVSSPRGRSGWLPLRRRCRRRRW